MIGIIEIDEKDVSDDRHIILEFPVEPERNDGMQTYLRVKTNIKFIEWSTYGTGGINDDITRKRPHPERNQSYQDII